MPHFTASEKSAEVIASGEKIELDRTLTVLLVGVGGQGTILAGSLLAMAAADAGLDVKVSEIHGMSQRGGSVSTVVRMGSKVESMVADPGCADVIVAFESVEALRAQDYLREGGKMFVNDEVIVPVSVAIGNFEMPEDIEGKLDELGAVRIPAGQIAREVGSPRSTNVVLVGALSTALPFSVEDWEDAISRRVPPKTVDANLKAFRQGRAAAEA
ncbi:indolepyruvate oxidoreductase subunit beta [Paratractidigestivibacter sp.]|uniref:indolepyruvate oxidoreductase subunit beta n=1 Tax=Paratractidigestivibacter sp. TaxID=2847316 RepID=UPI003AB7B06A